MVSAVRVSAARAIVPGIVALTVLLAAQPAGARCADWEPLARGARYAARSPTARDLIELVNFGGPDAEPVGGAAPFGLSPDGRFVATVVQRADLGSNGYCQALILLDRTGRQPPLILDRGGDFIMMTVPFRGLSYPNGFPRPNIARWSADGRSIAYVKRLDGISRVWLASPDGKPARPLTPSGASVERWAWGDDGRTFLYTTLTGQSAAEAAIDREGVTGWHYDERFDPGVALRPQVRAPLPEFRIAIDPATGARRDVSAADDLGLAQGGDPPLSAERSASGGVSAWVAADGMSPFAPGSLKARDEQGQPIACTLALCRGKFLGLWPDGKSSFTVMRAEGWHDRYTALYRWTPGAGARLLLRTDDVVQGCLGSGRLLLCVREGALQPPRLVEIDRQTGGQHIVFDPNPGFAALRLGRVQRLEWTNGIGHKVYGDLVVPPDYRGERLPVVVVQYRSRGFLRGGTGNDYAIQLFAARGFAVLSIDKPDMAAADVPTIVSWDDVTRANTRDWAERRNTLSAINTGLDLLIARGIADPRRLGLTGLSDGGSSVRFALINSGRFAAAATSSCCIDEASDELIGPAWEAYSRSVGYPPAWPVDAGFWRPYSFALNADRVRTPLLMQLADSETLMGLHAFTALRSAGAPVDLYVFPDEFHIKWQPQHRAAVWDRALDWFSFWLQGRVDPVPAKESQFGRWRSLRGSIAKR